MKKFFIAVLALFITGLVYAAVGATKEGEQIGTIVKIEKVRVFHTVPFLRFLPFPTTYEAELVTGGLVDGSGVMGTRTSFTIPDGVNLPVAYQAMQSGKVVDLKFHSDLFAPFSSGNHDNNFADDIMILNIPKPHKS